MAANKAGEMLLSSQCSGNNTVTLVWSRKPTFQNTAISPHAGGLREANLRCDLTPFCVCFDQTGLLNNER